MIFEYILQQHGDAHWGHILDAGAGVKSVRWLLTLNPDRITAVTGSRRMARRIREEAGTLRPDDRVLVGNWQDPKFLEGETFDTVLADYLIGAVDAFAPYAQDAILERIASICRGRFYFVGLEPYVVRKPPDEAGELIWQIGRLRDAVLLHAGQWPYREFPLEWTLRHLERTPLKVNDIRRFPIRFRRRFIDGQLNMCTARLPLVRDDQLRASLEQQVEALRAQAYEAEERLDGLRCSFDYVIQAENTATG